MEEPLLSGAGWIQGSRECGDGARGVSKVGGVFMLVSTGVQVSMLGGRGEKWFSTRCLLLEKLPKDPCSPEHILRLVNKSSSEKPDTFKQLFLYLSWWDCLSFCLFKGKDSLIALLFSKT